MGNSTTWDTTYFPASGSTAAGTHRDTPNDIFQLPFRAQDVDHVIKVRVELLLDTWVNGTAPDVANYFWYEWYPDTPLATNPNNFDPDVFGYSDSAQFMADVKANLTPGISVGSNFSGGSNFWGMLTALRSQFKRAGTKDGVGWDTIKNVKLIVLCDAPNLDSYFGNAMFVGGDKGQLNGYYKYIQVNVYDSTSYSEVGLASTPTDELTLLNGRVNVTPASLGSATKAWIFRASTQTPGYYRAWEVYSTSAFIDDRSDIDVYRDSIRLEDFRTALPDNIQTVLGPYYDRMIYFDYSSMYVSYPYDPGTYDARHKFQIVGTKNETILWAERVVDGEILVGTTADIYSVRGDLAYDETTGLLNVSVVGIGVGQPPTSSAKAKYDNTIIYLAEDGWRSIAGSSTYSLVTPIDLLYRGYDRHGINAVTKQSRNSSITTCCVSNNRLICSIDHGAYGRALHVYHFGRKQWSFWHNDITSGNNPQALAVEDDGTVLFGTNNAGDNYLYKWDVGYTVNASSPQRFKLRTIIDHDNKPSQRKQSLLLRVRADTGNTACTVTVYGIKDSTPTKTSLSFSLQCNGIDTKVFDISSGLEVPNAYQIEIGGDVTAFKLLEFAVEYIECPPATNYLLIPQDNMGIAGRKRIPVIPFAIDTRGNTVNVTPILDGVVQSAQTFVTGSSTTASKTVKNYYFATDKVATDIGLILWTPSTTQKFEFYGLVQSKNVEQLPDPTAFAYSPPNNFGTTKRKRFSQVAFIIDCKGNPISLTPTIDGVAFPSFSYSHTGKKTVIYTFTTDAIGVDLSATFDGGGNDFEFYGLSMENSVYESLPSVARYAYINTTNFGTSKRKRFVQLALSIDTKGSDITFSPYLDGVAQTVEVFNTGVQGKTTHIYYFESNAIGVDFRATLSSSTGEFEFYEMVLGESIFEALPTAVKYMKMAVTNFGSASKKRVRTWPFVLDCKGGIVYFKSYVDGVLQPTTTFSGSVGTGKRTYLHYFASDVFGIDYEGEFYSVAPFEYYQALQPEVVEVLPVGKLWDQLGPSSYNRQARVRGFRVRWLPTGTNIDYTIYSSDVSIYTGSITVVPDKEQVSEVSLPKGINVSVFRVEFTSTEVFHRFNGEFKLDITGSRTELRWVTVR